ncbi:MAG: hypothetical protein ACI8S6_000675 [Myxococcota bacterium]|jgi:hypothetical protein
MWCLERPTEAAIVVLWALPACSVPSDHERYLDALAVLQPEDLSPCDRIGDTDLKGDCQLALSERMVRSGEWCAQIVSEPWRGECWFSAAEGARDARRWEQAVQYCQSAGPFVDACSRHLWQPQLDQLLLPHRGRDFRASMVAVETAYRSWLPLLGDSLTQPFWFNYARGVFRHAPHADVAWCAQLASTHLQACQNAYRQLQERPPPTPPQRRR